MQWSTQKRGQLGLLDATTEFGGRAADSFDGTDEVVHQLFHIVRTTVGQISLGQGPDPLVGIEFRRVGREVLDMKAGMAALEFRQRFSVVGLRVVQDGDYRAAQVPQQIAKEHANLIVPDIVEVELIEKSQVLALGTDGDSRDDGDFVPAVTVPVHRSLASWRPGLDYIRDQQESGFVGKDDVGAQPRSVFFTRGHSFCFQRSIASSFRSTARFSGF